MKTYFYLCILLFPFFLYSQSQSIIAKHQAEIAKQGKITLNIAEGFFQDRKYEECAAKLKEYLLLFPDHPDRIKTMRFLETTYKKLGKSEEIISTNWAIYKEYPNNEEGFRALLEIGREYTKTGEIEKAIQIFKDIKNQVYSVTLSKEAENEINQIQILEEK